MLKKTLDSLVVHVAEAVDAFQNKNATGVAATFAPNAVLIVGDKLYKGRDRKQLS